MKPRLLDLFCGAGGAAMGYSRAGFEILGVDIKPQPHYPFEFVQLDAFAYLDRLLADPEVQDEFGFRAVHASPPCQAFSAATNLHRGRADQHPNLIPGTRDRLVRLGIPYVIENVMGAPLVNPIMLCGTMFNGLKVYRHRLFETHPPTYWPPYHNWHEHRPAPVGTRVPDHGWMTVAGHFNGLRAGREAMGIDWMTQRELVQAIPPAYTEWIGNRLLHTPKAAARHDPSICGCASTIGTSAEGMAHK